MIDEKSTFADIVKHLDSFDELPKTLDGKNKYYADVTFTKNIWIRRIHSEHKRLGDKIKQSQHAMDAKRCLIQLCKDLENKEKWNYTPPVYKAEKYSIMYNLYNSKNNNE